MLRASNSSLTVRMDGGGHCALSLLLRLIPAEDPITSTWKDANSNIFGPQLHQYHKAASQNNHRIALPIQLIISNYVTIS